ncbi:unnamed protein product [Discula destructiva]
MGKAGLATKSTPTNKTDFQKKFSEASDETDTGVEQLENVQSTSSRKRLGKRRRVIRHCARFWLWWLIGVITFLAIFLPLLFVKIIPAIIQDIINTQDLPLLNAEMGAKSETQLSIAFNTVFKIPGSMSARMDAMNLSMYNKFTPGYYPYTYVVLPGKSLHGSTTIALNESTPVLNDTEMTRWLTKTFNDITTDISFRGETTLHLGALKAPIKIDKTVTVAGLNQLQGFALDTLQILSTPEKDGSNVVGNLTLPNPSSVTINFGDLLFNTSIANILIGNVTVSNAKLVQGNNTIPFTGKIDLTTVVDNLSTISANSSSDGDVQMVISGGQCFMDGQHITYVEDALSGVSLSTPFNLTQTISSLLGGT